MKWAIRYLFFGLFLVTSMSCARTNTPKSSQEQTLRISLRKEPVSLDPRKGNDMVASQVQFMLFEGLVRLESNMSLSPAQAEKYDVSPDGRLYTFHLRKSVWSDGTPVTAHDFERAWKSMLDPQFPAPDAYLLYPIRNAKRAKEGLVAVDEVGIRSVNERTLLVELDAPTPHFLQVVASSVFLPIHPLAQEMDLTWGRHPKSVFSNGPFRLKEWKFNQEIILEKNPLYYEADRVKLSRLFIDILDREMAALHMHASGHFDLVGSPLSFFPNLVVDDLDKRKLLTFFPVATTKFLAFNTNATPFDNPNIRRAFAHAISRQSLVEHVTRLGEQAALNVLPPALLRGDLAYFADGDAKRARAFLEKGLAELGIERLKGVTFMYVSSEINHLLAQSLQQMWSSLLGVDVTLQHVEFKDLHARSKKGDFSIGLFAWLADYGDPMNILERFVDKTCHRNYPKWESLAYARILEEASLAKTGSEYLRKIQEAERILIDEMPLTCLYHESYAFLIHPHVQGFAVSPLGHIYFDRISVDVAKKRSAGF